MAIYGIPSQTTDRTGLVSLYPPDIVLRSPLIDLPVLVGDVFDNSIGIPTAWVVTLISE